MMNVSFMVDFGISSEACTGETAKNVGAYANVSRFKFLLWFEFYYVHPTWSSSVIDCSAWIWVEGEQGISGYAFGPIFVGRVWAERERSSTSGLKIAILHDLCDDAALRIPTATLITQRWTQKLGIGRGICTENPRPIVWNDNAGRVEISIARLANEPSMSFFPSSHLIQSDVFWLFMQTETERIVPCLLPAKLFPAHNSYEKFISLRFAWNANSFKATAFWCLFAASKRLPWHVYANGMGRKCVFEEHSVSSNGKLNK